jgi:tetratricopeptide (TPR) repeat protein
MFQQTGDQREMSVVVNELKKSIALNPLSAKPFKFLGDVYGVMAVGSGGSEQQQSWLRLASAAYEQTVECEPFNPFHRLELGRLYLALAEGGTAERSVREAVDMEPNFLPGRIWLARWYLKTGRIDLAKQEYEEILRRQRYYANWSIGAYERSFLDVDVRELAALLERPRNEKPKKRHTL